MENKKTNIQAYFLFFVLTIASVWLIALPGILNNYGVTDFSFPFELLIIIGSWSPNIIAFLVVGYVLKINGGVKKLINRWTMFKTPVKWYIISAIPLFISIVSLGLFSVFDGNFNVTTKSVNLSTIFIMLVMALITGAMGEELGWRGFALPFLQTKFSALGSSIIIGVIWGLWHFPLWLTGMGWSEMSFLIFMYSCVVISIFMTWICNNTKGNLMLITLTHLFYNFGLSLLSFVWKVPANKALIYQAILMTIISIIIIIKYGYKNLSNKRNLPINPETKLWK